MINITFLLSYINIKSFPILALSPNVSLTYSEQSLLSFTSTDQSITLMFSFVTNSAYGFTLHKMVCLAFVQHPDTIKGSPTTIDQRWLSDRSAKWTINIAGKMVN